jgi:hypothetical protein
MMDTTPALPLDPEDLPSLHRAADRVSLDGQQSYMRWIHADLAATAAAAAFGAVGAIGPGGWRRAATIVAVIALIIATILRWVTRVNRPNRAWFDGRAVAESVKTAAWRFVMHAVPYSGDTSHAERTFVDRVQAIMAERRDLSLASAETASVSQISPRMREIRALPFLARRRTYLASRLSDQIDWYSRRGHDHRVAARRWFVIGVVFELAALAAAVLRVADLGAVNLIGVFTTFAAGVTAVNQLHGHDELARSYGLAAQELSSVGTLLEAADEQQFLSLVGDAEGAISREHTMWMAKRT